MPELPEVETVLQEMRKSLLGNTITDVEIFRYDLRGRIPENFSKLLIHKRCNLLQRRGKYIILHFDDSLCAVLHLGMSGRIRIYESAQSYQIQKHDHVILKLSDRKHVVFNDPRRFGMFYTVDKNDMDTTPPFSAMGPEPLENWNTDDLASSLRNRKGPIKVALLDQRVVAGLGNIYVCEALFCAGIAPQRSSMQISKNELDRLIPCIKNVLQKAIKAGGSTLRDYQKTDGSLGYFQYEFDVYDREEQNCHRPKCKGIIKRIVQGGRSTFYCPVCQK